MTETGFSPALTLATYMKEMDADQAVKVARELCSQLGSDPESFHGNIWPKNIYLAEGKKAVLGAASRAPVSQRSADQVEYVSPEFFWDSTQEAAADVYSVGLLLYAGCNGGYLPFQPIGEELTDKDRSSALRRRMKGEKIEIPAGVSPELANVIEKALAYEPEDRYITARELLAALNETDEALPSGEDVAAVAGAAAGAILAGDGEQTDIPDEDVPEEDALEENIPEEDPAELREEAIEEETPEEKLTGEEPFEEEALPEGLTDEEIEQANALEPTEEEAAAAVAAVAAVAGTADLDGAAAPAVDAGDQSASDTPKYTVQKDFEQTRETRRQSVTPTSRRRKRSSPLVPILGAVAAVAVVAGAGALIFGGNSDQEVSQPFTTADRVSTAAPSPSPVVITPAPNNLLDDEDDKTAEETPRPSESPDIKDEDSHDGENEPGAAGSSGTDNSADTGAGNGSGITSNSSGTTGTNAGTGGTGSGTTSGGTGIGVGTTSGGSTGGGTTSGGTTGTQTNPSYTVTPADGTVYIQGIGVNIRSGPGTNYPIIGSASTGYELTRTGTVNGWTRVNFKGTVGFVSSTYLTDTAPTTETAAPTVTPAPTQAPAPTPEAPPTPASTFAVQSKDLTYDQAKKAAEADGLSLAVVANDDDFNAIVEKLNGSSVKYAWLGAAYDSSALAWKWSDGTTLSGDDSHWAADNPHNGDDILLLALLDGQWQYISVASSTFDPTSSTYAGQLGYVTG